MKTALALEEFIPNWLETSVITPHLHGQLFTEIFEEDKKIGQSKWQIILIHFDLPS